MSACGRLVATILPEGREAELWIVDGRIRFEGPEDAPLLARPGGYLLSGLVDCHSHISWPHDRATPAHTPAFMNDNRAVYAATGVTLLRDMGSFADAVIALPDTPGLPRVRASGTLLLRHEKWPFTPTPPERLREVALAQVGLGAPWVKVFSDWSNDYSGRENTAFTGEDELTYEPAVLAGMVRAVHDAGGRVAAHCFTRAGAEVAIDAGADSLEHGWGVDEPLLRRMAERGTAWAPLFGIGIPMRETAIRFGEPARVAWMNERMEAMYELVPLAHRLGVTILTGTDWFPEVTVADEMIELSGFGLPIEAALGAGTFTARAFLGEPGIEDGARADLVLSRTDPRARLDALLTPELVVIGGERVTPSSRYVKPKRARWIDVRPR